MEDTTLNSKNQLAPTAILKTRSFIEVPDLESIVPHMSDHLVYTPLFDDDHNSLVTRTSLSSKQLATLHVKKIVPGARYYGSILKFRPGGHILHPIKIDEPHVVICLQGELQISAGDENHKFVLCKGGGMYLNVGDYLQVSPVNLEPSEDSYLCMIQLDPKEMTTAFRKKLSVRRRRYQQIESNPDSGVEKRIVVPRPRYTREQKEKAVFLVHMGMDFRSVAKNFGEKCCVTTVKKWISDAQKNDVIRQKLSQMLVNARNQALRESGNLH